MDYYNNYITNYYIYISSKSHMCTMHSSMCSTNWPPNSLPADLIAKYILKMRGHRKQYPQNYKHYQLLLSALISGLILFKSNCKLYNFIMLFNLAYHIDSSVVPKPISESTMCVPQFNFRLYSYYVIYNIITWLRPCHTACTTNH